MFKRRKIIDGVEYTYSPVGLVKLVGSNGFKLHMGETRNRMVASKGDIELQFLFEFTSDSGLLYAGSPKLVQGSAPDTMIDALLDEAIRAYKAFGWQLDFGEQRPKASN